jgi:hypothetical protein
MIHGRRIRDRKLQCIEDWHKLVEAIELMDETIHHLQWEDAKLWIEQQTDYDRQLYKLVSTVRDDYLACYDSYNQRDNRLQLCYVE